MTCPVVGVSDRNNAQHAARAGAATIALWTIAEGEVLPTAAGRTEIGAELCGGELQGTCIVSDKEIEAADLVETVFPGDRDVL
jgi:hypothetical protein